MHPLLNLSLSLPTSPWSVFRAVYIKIRHAVSSLIHTLGHSMLIFDKNVSQMELEHTYRLGEKTEQLILREKSLASFLRLWFSSINQCH